MIEAIYAIEKSAAPGINPATGLGIPVVQRARIPSVERNFANSIHSVAKQIPEQGRIVCSRRHAAAKADYRHGLSRLLIARLQSSLQLDAKQR